MGCRARALHPLFTRSFPLPRRAAPLLPAEAFQKGLIVKYLLSLLFVLAFAATEDARAQQNSVVTVDQAGSAHQATVSQMGGPGNEATITQAGDHGVVVLDQQGAGNTALLNMLPGAGYAGSANYILLLQSGGATAEVSQTGSDNAVWGLNGGEQARSLHGSVLDVVQMGMGNRLFLDQQNASSATIVQMGIGNTATVIQSQ